MQNKKESTEIVSVIIPVYNVDKYLKRCIDSVLKQTFIYLDIILVDDGSTDRSGDICDYYAKTDKRVRVLHKKNGGQSDARNAGLEMTKGEYIYFVDSDDFIAVDAIEYLRESLLYHDADITTHGYVVYYGEDAGVGAYKSADNEQSVLSNNDALEQLLYEKSVTTSACMKLYKRRLFSPDIRFPLGKVCEDLAIVYRLFSKTDKVVLNTIPKYYYYKRRGSTTQSDFNDSSMDGLDIAKEQLEFVSNNHPTLTLAAQYRLFAEAIYIVMKTPLNSRLYKNERKALLQVISKYRGSVLFNRKARGSMRQRALIAFLGTRTMVYSFKIKSLVWRLIKRIIS